MLTQSNANRNNTRMKKLNLSTDWSVTERKLEVPRFVDSRAFCDGAWTPFFWDMFVAANDRGVDALAVLRQCAENLKALDRIQHEVTIRRSYQVSAPWPGGLPSQNVQVAVKRDGDKIEVTGIRKQYRDGKFVGDEHIHQLSIPDFMSGVQVGMMLLMRGWLQMNKFKNCLQEAIPCEGKDRDDVIAEGKVQVCMKLGDFLFRLCLR